MFMLLHQLAMTAAFCSYLQNVVKMIVKSNLEFKQARKKNWINDDDFLCVCHRVSFDFLLSTEKLIITFRILTNILFPIEYSNAFNIQ